MKNRFNKNKNTFWYFPLEIQESRYTNQLCNFWIPDAFKNINNKLNNKFNFRSIKGKNVPSQIKVGQVLDATGRGKYSLSQVYNFLQEIENNKVKDNDIIYLQDYWTPGIEAIWYALDLYNIKVKVYSMCHAQSVDIYDFTYPMRKWMRLYELGLDKVSTGIFVGSSIHKQQLKKAGFSSPIHVVSLPLGLDEVSSRMGITNKNIKKSNSVIFSSRLDKEKQPEFMLEIAEKFLKDNPNWKWYITTSGKEFRSSIPNFVEKLKLKSKQIKNLYVLSNLTKEEYYELLKKSKIQFNCSLQDYVSWTLLEASTAGCDICYPNFRSFPECISKDRLYKHQDKDSALKLLNKMVKEDKFKKHNMHIISNKGRLIEMEIMLNDIKKEYNIWKECDIR